MKKFSLITLISLISMLVILLCSCSSEGENEKKDLEVKSLNVYNWGEYISDEDDEEYGLIDVNAKFEEYFNNNLAEKYGYYVEVNYSTYATNEDMYAKITNSAVAYDIIIPSDYMIQKMIAEERLLEIDYSKLTNYGNIDDSFKGLYYDPEDKYSVPYTFGMLGVIYNAEFVAEEDAEDKSWDILLLDIEMGAMDGVTMAKRVRRDNEAVQILFITGYSDYIAEGYEVAALHYLMKPVREEKLFSVLDRAVEKRKQQDRFLNLSLSGELVRLPLYEIRYLDVHQNYVTVHAKTEYTVKRTLGDFEKELDDRFHRVGRSIILNLKCIQRVTKTEVHLSDGTVLLLPRGAYEPLNRAIIAHT